jgi:hypothetical protein
MGDHGLEDRSLQPEWTHIALAMIVLGFGQACGATSANELVDDAQPRDEGVSAGDTSNSGDSLPDDYEYEEEFCEVYPPDSIVPEPSPSLYLATRTLSGCTSEGPPLRLMLFQREPELERCTELVLQNPAGDGFRSTAFSRPSGWAAASMRSYSCDSDADAVAGATVTFEAVSGRVSFGGNDNGLPIFVQLDVTLASPTEAEATERALSSSVRLQTCQIEVSSRCEP